MRVSVQGASGVLEKRDIAFIMHAVYMQHFFSRRLFFIIILLPFEVLAR